MHKNILYQASKRSDLHKTGLILQCHHQIKNTLTIYYTNFSAKIQPLQLKVYSFITFAGAGKPPRAEPPPQLNAVNIYYIEAPSRGRGGERPAAEVTPNVEYGKHLLY